MGAGGWDMGPFCLSLCMTLARGAVHFPLDQCYSFCSCRPHIGLSTE